MRSPISVLRPFARALVVLLVPLLVLTACGNKDGGTKDPGSSGTSAAGECTYPSDGQSPARKVKAPPSNPITKQPTDVVLKTSQGNIRITLEADKAPCTVNSFLSLAKQGYFDDTTCHRLTTAGIYVLQCGDPTATGMGGPGYAFADELLDGDSRIEPCHSQDLGQGPVDVCTYGAGTVAMANSGPNTNGSQFFLVYKSSPLPAAYTVFGRMDASGLQVVDKVARAGTTQQGATDGKPKRQVKITGVTLDESLTASP